ncbi:serine O-acetyltransferase [Gottfriedia acidiceleris]|uniref:serine O-acetyltransferase n=1 Tax=Gottfriedia acidiceleris TaxID=371036 RepID=UPI00101C5DBE|nr:serine O-acetyltransferase [Gottfriedia acidiceleris]
MEAIKLYRIANKLYKHKIPVLPKIFYRMIYLINNCHIHYTTKIGKGTKLGYGGISVVIHKDAEIGDNCMIGSCVTIGGRSGIKKLPVIGNNVYIGTGAKILGDLKIGDNSVIGANAVVITDFPANSIIAGVPAKLLKNNNLMGDIDK